MKKFLLTVLMIWLVSSFSFAQEQQAPPAAKKKSEPMDIRTGFYMRWGPMFPLGDFSMGQWGRTNSSLTSDPDGYTANKTYFEPPRIGASAELGSQFYTGPAFAHKYLRVGIDATFANLWMAPTESKDLAHWYWFFSQKVGPIITLSFPGGVMLDFGVKFCPTISRGSEIWGRHINEELIMNFKFHELQCSFQYGMGTMNYTNFSGTGDDKFINIESFRILIGMKIH